MPSFRVIAPTGVVPTKLPSTNTSAPLGWLLKVAVPVRTTGVRVTLIGKVSPARRFTEVEKVS